MATTVESNFRTFVAGADLSAKQFFLVKLSSGNVVVSTAATDKIIGVLDNAPVSGDDAVVRLLSSSGTGKVKTGGSGSAGDKLTSDGAGKAITTTTSTNRVFGLALTDFTSGDVVEYLPVTEVVA
jgi:hypothetical protein